MLTLEVKSCDSAYDELDRANPRRFRLERSAAYLNWRYRANPLVRHELVAARREGELQGYAVFSHEGPHAVLSDLVAREDRVTRFLLDGVADLLRARGAVTLSAPALASHPLIPHLLRCGFRAREGSPAILYRRPRPEASAEPDTSAEWPLLYGDRDS
jgi:hypothetical protein